MMRGRITRLNGVPIVCSNCDAPAPPDVDVAAEAVDEYLRV